MGPAPRRADDHQGVVRRGGDADHLGAARAQGQHRRRATRSRWTGCSRRAWCSSARPTCRSWLADWQSYNDIYGTTNNPWDLSRTPGGSSGGSAAALAAGLTGLEAGSDIGSSIRNPAHYCGVYGHKPTYGIVPPRGQALPGRVAQGDISVIGPLARSADDLALGLAAMAGADEIDGAGWRLALPAPDPEDAARVQGGGDAERSRTRRWIAEVQARLQALADFLGKKKAKVSLTARPDIDTAEAHRIYVFLLRAATAGRQTPEEFRRNAEIARGLAPDDERYYARMMRANTASHRDWLAANELRHKMRWRWAEFFREWDLLLCPAAASAAFPHDHVGERHDRTIVVNGRRVPTTDQLFWAGYSGVAYLPSTVAPCGFTPGGLPVGVQIVGPQYGDRTCIELARLLEREFQGFRAPAGLPLRRADGRGSVHFVVAAAGQPGQDPVLARADRGRAAAGLRLQQARRARGRRCSTASSRSASRGSSR